VRWGEDGIANVGAGADVNARAGTNTDANSCVRTDSDANAHTKANLDARADAVANTGARTFAFATAIVKNTSKSKCELRVLPTNVIARQGVLVTSVVARACSHLRDGARSHRDMHPSA
jgi:hypothetical protein